MPQVRKPAKREGPTNLFRGFKFRGRLKESPSGLDAAKFDPVLHVKCETDFVRTIKWWDEEDDCIEGGRADEDEG